ncbi:hypothetical protein PGTUg99_028009 [Puccinia graminis f. sp. tritici]|uniref:Uncharacterized protein n=1 Tax=Puccinia graminis f. sp. tritici TaxID=56615 RepID=A0A5B0SJ37_PUCGR|nr:hypothetical protein PGTUg99_028009 [Puccinia graminis f. sp. tritici]
MSNDGSPEGLCTVSVYILMVPDWVIEWHPMWPRAGNPSRAENKNPFQGDKSYKEHSKIHPQLPPSSSETSPQSSLSSIL